MRSSTRGGSLFILLIMIIGGTASPASLYNVYTTYCRLQLFCPEAITRLGYSRHRLLAPRHSERKFTVKVKSSRNLTAAAATAAGFHFDCTSCLVVQSSAVYFNFTSAVLRLLLLLLLALYFLKRISYSMSVTRNEVA